jgi:4-amino-4-deoxy-L-arabinose transferase-like glycosyltransferase
MTNRQSTGALLLALAVATATLFYKLDAIPGLHGDEAWAGLRAHAILHGQRPTTGMNTYTGPLYGFLLAPVIWLLGANVFALRALTVAAAIVTVGLYHRATARWFDPTIAAYASLTLVTMPFFTAFGRLAGENFALNPLLATAALAMLADVGRAGPRASASLAVGAGVCLGLGIWNHAIFVTVPVALAAAACYRLRTAVFRSASVWLVCAGCAAMLVPSLVIQAGISSSERGPVPDAAVAGYLTGLMHRAVDWPLLLPKLAHGDLLFRRFAGELAVPLPNVMAILSGAGIVVLWVRRTEWPNATPTLVLAGALFIATLLIVPGNGERYFLLILYFVPIFLAAAIVWLRAAVASRRAGVAIQAAFVVFLTVQLARIGVNYFGAQERTHGLPVPLWLERQPETSAHFMRSDGLYRRLVSLGATDVVGEFFIAQPLRFYDLAHGTFSSVTVDDKQDSAPPVGSYAVYYSAATRHPAPRAAAGYDLVFEDSQFTVMRRVATHEPHREPAE